MGKFRKLPVVIEAITFNELVQHGKDYEGSNIVNGFPWSFKYNNHPITHENDKCYLIQTLEGTMNFTPSDVLITGIKGEIYPCKKDIFESTYELVENQKSTFAFGEAIQALKQGKLVARQGWNGKGMFIVKQIPGVIGVEIIPRMASLPESVKTVFIERNQSISYESQMLIIKAYGSADSWVPSSSDVFAEDWVIVE